MKDGGLISFHEHEPLHGYMMVYDGMYNRICIGMSMCILYVYYIHVCVYIYISHKRYMV